MNRTMVILLLLVAPALLAPAAARAQKHESLVAPLDHLHNHSSSIVELANGDLLVCWYRGSGERRADDVAVMAARWKRDGSGWGERYLLYDTPNFPDTNPILFVDSRERLWFIWSTILANRWETALTQYRVAGATGARSDPPRWERGENLLFIPRNFEKRVKEVVAPWLENRAPGPVFDEIKHAYDRAGDKYFSRMGWMARIHPLELPSGRILVPLYSDGYNFSLIAITDDGGKTWSSSEPVLSEGGVQPSLVRRKDGTLAAYMRDNGPPPKRVLVSTSSDDGITWTTAVDSDIPNPGASVEVIALRDGSWLMVLNDTEKGRHSLAVWLSEDEGQTWPFKRHLEHDTAKAQPTTASYPSVIQSKDGLVHVTYTYTRGGRAPGEPYETIKHVRFPVEWVREGR